MSPKTSLLDIFLIPAEDMADFMEESDADLVREREAFFLCIITNVTDPESDTHDSDGILIEVAKGVGFYSTCDIVRGGV